jgi:hypothetical protein
MVQMLRPLYSTTIKYYLGVCVVGGGGDWCSGAPSALRLSFKGSATQQFHQPAIVFDVESVHPKFKKKRTTTFDEVPKAAARCLSARTHVSSLFV